MMLSIVTVTFNDPAGLGRTLESIARTIGTEDPEVEVIVKNGASLESIAHLKTQHSWAKFVTTPDSGTYDGMNQALETTQGRYVWFLNGGDESVVTDWRALRKMLAAREEILLADYIRVFPNFAEARRSRSSTYIWHALPTSHQAIFYPGDAARAVGYDLSYSVSADYAFTARLLAAGLSASTVPITVARFHTGGLSTQRSRQVAKDAGRVQRDILKLPVTRRLRSRFRHLAARSVSSLKNRSSSATRVVASRGSK